VSRRRKHRKFKEGPSSGKEKQVKDTQNKSNTFYPIVLLHISEISVFLLTKATAYTAIIIEYMKISV